MSQMGVAAAADCFRADHAVAHVALHFHIFGSDGLVVTRPSGTGVIFGVRAEKRLTAANANVGSFRLRVGVLAGEWRLGPLLARNFKLLVGQLRPPFRVVLFNFFAHAGILHGSRNSWKWGFGQVCGGQWKLKPRQLYWKSDSGRLSERSFRL